MVCLFDFQRLTTSSFDWNHGTTNTHSHTATAAAAAAAAAVTVNELIAGALATLKIVGYSTLYP